MIYFGAYKEIIPHFLPGSRFCLLSITEDWLGCINKKAGSFYRFRLILLAFAMTSQELFVRRCIGLCCFHWCTIIISWIQVIGQIVLRSLVR